MSERDVSSRLADPRSRRAVAPGIKLQLNITNKGGIDNENSQNISKAI